MRADGRQNRQKLIDAAERLFAERGTNVSVADIVAAAGVAPPTLYRHFGDKDGLIKAIGDRTSESAMAGLAHALTQPTAWDGFVVAINDSIDIARLNTAVRQRSGVAISPALEGMLLSGWEELVRRGREEGSIRDDFAPSDVPFLFAAAASVADAVDYEPMLVERYVAMLLQGIRPGPEVLPGRAPSRAELSRAFRIAGSNRAVAPTQPESGAGQFS